MAIFVTCMFFFGVICVGELHKSHAWTGRKRPVIYISSSW